MYQLEERFEWVFNQVPDGLEWILDVGCFDGRGTEPLLVKAESIMGIDLDMAGLNKGISFGTKVDLICASGVHIPFPNAAFDCVVFSETFEHIPQDLEQKVISEIYRVLKPGGLLLLTVPHAGLFQHLDPMNFRRNIRQLARKLGIATLMRQLGESVVNDAKGHKHYKAEELHALLTPLFAVVSIQYTGLILYPISLLMGVLPQNILRRKRIIGLRKWLAHWDYQHGFGKASYNLALVAKAEDNSA